MTLSKLAIALVIIFCLFTVAIIGEYLFVQWRRRSFRHRSSPAPPIEDTRIFSFADAATKEQLYFFSLKPLAPVQLDPLVENMDGSTLEDEVAVDVLKLKEVTPLTRFPSTIKEEGKEKEEAESTPDVDFPIKPVEVDAEEVVAVTVDGDDGHTKTVFSTPCDSPVFYTPVGSPARDVMELPVFVAPVNEG